MNYFERSSTRAQLNVSFLLRGLLTVKLVEASACSGVEEDEGINLFVGGISNCRGEMGLDRNISLLWTAGSEPKSVSGMTLSFLDCGMLVTSSNWSSEMVVGIVFKGICVVGCVSS